MKLSDNGENKESSANAGNPAHDGAAKATGQAELWEVFDPAPDAGNCGIDVVGSGETIVHYSWNGDGGINNREYAEQIVREHNLHASVQEGAELIAKIKVAICGAGHGCSVMRRSLNAVVKVEDLIYEFERAQSELLIFATSTQPKESELTAEAEIPPIFGDKKD